jgi:serine protease inhibitor
LDQGNLDSWLVGFLDRPGKVRMPLFSVESDWDLREILKSLGMNRAFSEGADFRQAFTNAFGRTYLGSFQQKAFFETSAESMPASVQVPPDIDASPRHEHFSLSVDRPFFFLIRDNKTKVWLALGTVTKLD